ncbi:MAG: hypothetical protein LBJ24_05510, partial [Treponema sp.]|nr:hypothetical protein [Treponema sp.]
MNYSSIHHGALADYSNLLTQYAKNNGYDGIISDSGFVEAAAFSPEQIKSATDNAGTYGNENRSILFQTIGEQGAEALDRAEETAVRLDNKKIAEQMEAAGKDARAVRLATGWERGADGKWRYEIEDIPLDISALEQLNENRLNYNFRKKKPQPEYHAPLEEMITDKALVKTLTNAYGALPHITFSMELNTDGVYNRDSNSIDISTWVKGERIKSVLLHEIQHWIQEKEGFAPGNDMENGYADYHKSAGEVEARNVQARMGFTPQQRLETLLEDTEDVAREDQIFLAEGARTGAAMAMTGEETNDQFNNELIQYTEGKLPKNHVFQLGPPGEILQNTGFPNAPIELSASRLEEKSQVKRHPFNPGDLKDLVMALLEPVAVFAYGDRAKAQNVIVDFQKDGKNFLVGVHFEQEYRGTKVSDIRTIYNKDNHEWLNWINQGKLLYADIQKLQAVVAQQRMNAAEVGYLDLESINTLIQQNEGVKDYYASRIEGTVLFQDEEDLAAFMRNDPAVVRLSMTFDTPREFQDYYGAMEAYKQPGDLMEAAARKAFFTTIWEEGQKLKQQEAAQAGTGTGENAETGQKTAEDFLDLVNSEKGLANIVRITKGLLEGENDFQAEDEAAETQHNAEMAALKNAFDHQNWRNARSQISKNKPIAPSTARFLRGQVRNNPLPYMEAWAVISGDDSWLPSETRSRLADDGDFDYETDASPEELRRIEQSLGHDEIVRKIQDKTLKADDPQLDNYEAELKKRQKENQAKIEKKKETLSDYAWMIERAELNIEAQERLAAELAGDTTPEGITAARKQGRKVRDAQNRLLRLRREYASFLGSVKAADKANFKEFTTLKRMLARTENALRAAGDLRRIRKNEMKTVLKPPDMKTVHIDEARDIQWAQSFFDNLPEFLPKFIGPKAKNLMELISDFTTNRNGYRDKIKGMLRPGNYSQVERIIYKDTAARDVRAYSELTKANRHTLYRLLVENETLFKDLGLDAMKPPMKFSEAESERIRKRLEGRIPPDILYKMENRLTLDKWQMADMETLAGIMADIRKEGREHYQANKEAQNKVNRGYQGRFAKITGALLGPKDIERLPGAETDEAEEKRAKWRNLAFSLVNPRRIIRMFEGGTDGVMHDVVTGGYNRAFDEQTRHELARRKAVDGGLEAAGIKLRELWSNTFALADGRTVSLDEMLFYRRAALNDRAYAAVVFGNFAKQSERDAMGEANDLGRIDEVLRLEGEIVRRYEAAMAQLDAFLAKPENRKFRAAEDIIGGDYDGNYDRLNDFAARELNFDLGRESNYLPLGRKNAAATEHETIMEMFASSGIAHTIESGFFKARQDIAPWHQTEVRAGLYKTWYDMVSKQEHLMAFSGYLRDMRQIFQERGSETLRNNIKRKFSTAGTDWIDHLIAEIASPQTQRDYTNLNTITRIMRGHFPAAVLAFRLSSIIKQAITSPPPFLQFISAGEYAAAGVECLSEETRNKIRELSPYMASRVIDPANEFIRQMEMETLMGKGGKFEAALAKAERTGMKPLEWIDSVCVMPGWWGAYKKKLAELDRAGG